MVYKKSVSWNRATSPMSKEGLSMLDELTESLTKGERKARQEAIDKAKKWIINAGKNGGADASISKTFLIKGT